ncbi:MAG: DUF4349 domain-containing protein [Chitinophagales bacterium]|jgi:hypothetical protein|nr:DUF4349 domain-containing protein [Chitinophagales bacterium]
MKITFIISALFLASFTALSSCESKQKMEASALSAPPSSRDVDASALSSTDHTEEINNAQEKNNNNQVSESKKKIIKDGSITVKTNDINKSKTHIDTLLRKFNAYYEKEELDKSDQQISYNLKVRVPAKSFEDLISNIEGGYGEIENKSIQARDVTEEFVDIETRLANKRAYLKRYIELLAKTTSIKDILDIEEKIRSLQEEIESTEGRLKYLIDQVAISTIDIELTKEIAYIYKSHSQFNFLERIKASLSNGWAFFVSFILWIISIWPFLLLSYIGFYLFRRYRKNKNSDKA